MATMNFALPVAMVLSSVIVATGLYFGLRASQQQPVAVTPVTPVAPVTPVIAPAAAAPVPPAMTPEVKARALENARLALEGQRATMVDRCWAPAAAKQPEPRQIPLVFNLSFAPEGQLLAVGISETRGMDRPEVATCLRSLELRLKIPAPGGTLLLEVPFTLP